MWTAPAVLLGSHLSRHSHTPNNGWLWSSAFIKSLHWHGSLDANVAQSLRQWLPHSILNSINIFLIFRCAFPGVLRQTCHCGGIHLYLATNLSADRRNKRPCFSNNGFYRWQRLGCLQQWWGLRLDKLTVGAAFCRVEITGTQPPHYPVNPPSIFSVWCSHQKCFYYERQL